MHGSNMYMLMRKFFTNILVCAAALMAFAACVDKDAERLEMIQAEWHYTGVESGVEVDLYLGLYGDMTFELYQKASDAPHYLYKGKYSLNGDVLTGTYSDYAPWAHDYKVSCSNSSLTLTSVVDQSYSIAFKKESIPQSVRTHFLPMTKSENGTLPIL